MDNLPVFTIRLLYKSGYVHDFDVYEFSIKDDNFSWKAVHKHNKPVKIGVDDIAAVWQIGVRESGGG